MIYGKKKNTLLPQYNQAKEVLQKDIAMKKHLVSLAGQDQEKINLVKAEESEIKGQIEELNAKIQEIGEEIKKIREQRSHESQKIEELKAEKSAQHNVIHEKFGQHFEKQKLEKERREKAWQERVAENERRRKEWEEKKRKEEAERVPFEVEVQTCDSVHSYLEAQLKLYKGTAGIEKKKQQRSNRQRMHVLCHPPEMVQLFEYLSLVLPILQSELENSLAQVQTKKSMYLTLREKELEQRNNADKGKESEEPNAEGLTNESAGTDVEAVAAVEAGENGESGEHRADGFPEVTQESEEKNENPEEALEE